MTEIERAGVGDAVEDGYASLLADARASLAGARTRARRAINGELLRAYHQIGSGLNARRASEGSGRGNRGPGLVRRLAADLALEFPDLRGGLSRSNLNAMARFAAAYPDESFLHGAAGSLPWGHHIDILGRITDPQQRVWYIERAGHWSRKTLQANIASELHVRAGAAPSNFQTALGEQEGEQAQQLTQDPLLLDFIAGSSISSERTLELALLRDVEQFMLALGRGFHFAGRQVSLVVGQREFIIDLLFYHHPQRRFIVIELKVGDFDPEFAGKINLYVNAVDDQLAGDHDNATLGIVLCANRDEAVTELTLKGISSPVAVSTYQLGHQPHQAPVLASDVPDELREIQAVETDLQAFATRRVRELQDTEHPADDNGLCRVSRLRPRRNTPDGKTRRPRIVHQLLDVSTRPDFETPPTTTLGRLLLGLRSPDGSLDRCERFR